MINPTLSKLLWTSLATLVVLILAVFLLVPPSTQAHPLTIDATQVPDDYRNAKYLKDPCPADPKNLLQNAAMDPGGSSPYGSMVNSWSPFIFSGNAPTFRWVDNEGIYRGQSQQIYSSNAFDAGIYQVIGGLTPGNYYWFRLGWAPTAKSFGGANDPSPSVGVRVGVDPFGGTDPKSPNVAWGPGLFNDNKGLNRIQLTLLFPASASSVTIYMRAIATDGSGGENRVWLNAPCMEARPEIAPATPVPPTAPPTSTATATRPAPTRAPPTRAPSVVPTSTPTRIPEILVAPDTATSTAVMVIAAARASATPRLAHVDDAASSSQPGIDLGTGIVAGLGILLVIGAGLSFVIGFVWWQRIR